MATISDTRPMAPDPSRTGGLSLPGPLWVDGEFTLRLREPGSERVLRIRRPFALLGRIAGSDVRIEDRAVSARHVYLHLDRRGVFGVDLATRTGTRFGAAGHSSGWLHPGQAFEVAGRRIELLEVRLDGAASSAPLPNPGPADPLADAGTASLVAVTLHAMHARHVPRALGSELVFVGRGTSCGVRVEGATASRVHCVLVRTTSAAFVVDLIGRGTWLNGRLVTGAAALGEGDTLAIGSAQFGVRIAPASETSLAVRTMSQHQLPELTSPAGWPATFGDGSGLPAGLSPGGMPPASLFLGGIPAPPNSLPAEAQNAALAWMMGALQAGQTEALRRQGEFHLALTRLVQQMQRDHANLLNEHLDRMERIDRELADLRGEIYRRFGSAEAATAAASLQDTSATPSPEADVPPHLRIAPVPKPADTDPAATATWLITRVNLLEEEQRSTWKDMVSRLTGRGR
jgi:pSer/pThr/pTyr-binding forkhead associated (FHA) protein